MSDGAAYVHALPQALLVTDKNLIISYANPSAEDLFGHSAAQLKGKEISGWPVFADGFSVHCKRTLASGETISLFDETLYFLHAEVPVVIHIAPTGDELIITLEKQDGLQKLAARNAKNEAARASGVMAAMLAHEVKNPLSGIRGAAQLLSEEVSAEQRPLTELICSEADRIRDLLNQVEIFTAGSPELAAVNIHEVLQYVISIAAPGFARHVRFVEKYDPSLPNVLAHRDLLVQMCLNLVKNAAEALERVEAPVITLTTYYQSGYRVRANNSSSPSRGEVRRGAQDGKTSRECPHPNPPPIGEGEMIALPIAIDIEDNGPGISEHLREQLFEPFMSSKDEGRGLGLAVVAKIAADMGASIELGQKQVAGAKFTVRLAMANKQ